VNAKRSCGIPWARSSCERRRCVSETGEADVEGMERVEGSSLSSSFPSRPSSVLMMFELSLLFEQSSLSAASSESSLECTASNRAATSAEESAETIA
jgi:hypothetical protein